jgi:hypothetical protein
MGVHREGADGHQEQLLLVVACGGDRCAAVSRLRSSVGDVCGPALRAAVRARPDAVLMRTPCLRLCHRGGIAAVGWATAEPGRIHWRGSPVVIGGIESDERSASLAAWVETTAPRRATLPADLR